MAGGGGGGGGGGGAGGRRPPALVAGAPRCAAGAGRSGAGDRPWSESGDQPAGSHLDDGRQPGRTAGGVPGGAAPVEPFSSPWFRTRHLPRRLSPGANAWSPGHLVAPSLRFPGGAGDGGRRGGGAPPRGGGGGRP